MTTVGFIGSGLIGGTVARLAVAAGYDVVVSNSRSPETLADLVAELGPKARAATAAEAAGAGDLVVVSVPFHAHAQLPVAQLAGKVVLDTNNYYPERDGNFAELDEGKLTSAELEQRQLGTARVVKVFNNIFHAHLASLPRPSGDPERSPLTIAGDDPNNTRREVVVDPGSIVVDPPFLGGGVLGGGFRPFVQAGPSQVVGREGVEDESLLEALDEALAVAQGALQQLEVVVTSVRAAVRGR